MYVTLAKHAVIPLTICELSVIYTKNECPFHLRGYLSKSWFTSIY